MKRAIKVGAALLLSAVLLSGCGKEAAPEAKAPLVRAQTVAAGSAAQSAEYSGSVRGRYEKNMAFQVGGQIVARDVQLGDRVSAGAVMMRIDPKDVAQKTNAADAQAEAASAQLALAETNLARYRALYAEAAIAAAVLDQYQTAYDAALAAYQAAAAQRTEAHNALSYTELVADADGVVSGISAEIGQVVAAGQTVLTFVESGEMEVEIHVPENRLPNISVGKHVEVSFWAMEGAKARGVIREIAPMADSATRTYKVRVSVPNPPAGMALGMTASVNVTGEKAVSAATATLPLSAIYQTGEKPCVWLVVDGKVSLREVSVESFGANDAIVRGLSAGDVVVTAGVHKLHEGEDVRLGAEAEKP
ncbi:MAG: efflux RND transporter periplasmic adaptor subunit [Schwartzia sp.]|nr:efflux RND transporter periplasmic adaptor subunit [Schwartzia sp. (in: firmicutes)]